MEFKIKDKVLRVLNVVLCPGQYASEAVPDKKGKLKYHAVCNFRNTVFHAPPNTMVYQRASIIRGSNEYIVLWYISGTNCSVYLNKVNTDFSPGLTADQMFTTITDLNEFNDLNAFVVANAFDRIAVGGEVPYVIEENPLGFGNGKN